MTICRGWESTDEILDEWLEKDLSTSNPIELSSQKETSNWAVYRTDYR